MTIPQPDLVRLARTVAAATPAPDHAAKDLAQLLDGLHALHEMRATLDDVELALIEAARESGASWQALAPVLGVASRQAAERRYLRLIPATPEQAGSTRDQRVQQLRDRRAGNRAVTAWANHNIADLRQLAAQITALTDLDPAAAADIAQLHQALGHPDATALPPLLQQTRQHLDSHPGLGDLIDALTAHTTQVRRETQHQRDYAASTTTPTPATATQAMPTEVDAAPGPAPN